MGVAQTIFVLVVVVVVVVVIGSFVFNGFGLEKVAHSFRVLSNAIVKIGYGATTGNNIATPYRSPTFALMIIFF